MLIHPFEPVFDARSRVLILGSFPSVKSREEAFYYAHPRNRFWKLLAALFNEKPPGSVREKTELLLTHGLALWDVIYSCEIQGSSDASVRNARANNIPALLAHTRIERIYTNGAKAHELYKRLVYPACGISDIPLPSTSPANAGCSFDALIRAWKCVTEAADEFK